MSEADKEGAPTEEQVRIIVYQTMEQMFLQSQASTQLLLTIQAKLAGVEAVTPIVDENQAAAATAREVAAKKEIISHLYERAQMYVAVIVAGAFAAYFATLSVIAPRMPDKLLELSALLMTLSLSVFVLYEVFSISWTAYRVMRGDLGMLTATPRYMTFSWGAALLFTIVTAVPAIVLMVWAYLRGLGILP